MKTVKTIINDDADKAVQAMQEWFLSQTLYEEGDMIICIKPHEASEVHFVVEEA